MQDFNLFGNVYTWEMSTPDLATDPVMKEILRDARLDTAALLVDVKPAENSSQVRALKKLIETFPDTVIIFRAGTPGDTTKEGVTKKLYDVIAATSLNFWSLAYMYEENDVVYYVVHNHAGDKAMQALNTVYAVITLADVLRDPDLTKIACETLDGRWVDEGCTKSFCEVMGVKNVIERTRRVTSFD